MKSSFMKKALDVVMVYPRFLMWVTEYRDILFPYLTAIFLVFMMLDMPSDRWFQDDSDFFLILIMFPAVLFLIARDHYDYFVRKYRT